MKKYMIYVLVMLGALQGHAQDNRIKAIITDIDNQGIEGVRIHDQNKILISTSNRDGSIWVPKMLNGRTIHLSHHNYLDTVVQLLDGMTIVLKLRPKQLEEVIVSTGYERLPRERMTGAFEHLNEEVLNRNYTQDILGRLESMVSGMYFVEQGNTFSKIGRPADHTPVLHGISTLRDANKSNMPLIIWDNFPYDGDMNNIDPNDIESITILKDAAAAAIWGAKAGNGVIVITSKRAKLNQKLSANYRSSLSVMNKPDLFGHHVIAPADYIEVERFLFEKKYYSASETNRAKPALSPAVELLIKHRDQIIDDDELERGLKYLGSYDVRDDFLQYIYRNAIQTQHSIALSQGTDKVATGLNIGYDHSDALFRGNSNERLNLRFHNLIKITDRIDLTSNIRWVHYNVGSSSLPLSYSNTGFRYPYVRLADDNGNAQAIPRDYNLSYINSASNELLLDWNYRPLDEINYVTNNQKRNEIQFDVGLNFQILKPIQFVTNYQLTRAMNNHEEDYGLETYYTRNFINRGTELVNGLLRYNFPMGGIIRSSNNTSIGHNGRILIRSDHSFSAAHTLNGIIGLDINQSRSLADGYSKYGYNRETLSYANSVNHTLRYPVWDNLASVESVPYPINPSYDLTNRFVSYYANGSYSYSNKYIASFSVRKDASNLFGVSTNNKWTPLWSMGLVWNPSEEKFWKNEEISLKIRSTYGVSGNIDNSMSSLTTINYSTAFQPFNISYPFASVLSHPNPELRWEKVGNINLGIDITIGKDFSLIVDLYRKKTKDLFSNFPIDPTLGLVSQTMNVAHTKTNGLDFQMSLNKGNTNFKWRSVLKGAYNNTWIVKSFREYSTPVSMVNGGLSQIEGEIAFPFYSYAWAGLDPETGEARGYLNGEISKDYRKIMTKETTLDDLVFHGSSRPLYFGNFLNTFTYKNWNVSFNVTGQFKYFFRRSSINYSSLFSSGYGHSDYYDRWQKSGDEMTTDIPAFVYPLNYSETFYPNTEVLAERADHIRLKDIRVAKSIKINGVGKLDLSASCTNVGLLWKANTLKMDPTVNGGIPLPRGWQFGFNYTF